MSVKKLMLPNSIKFKTLAFEKFIAVLTVYVMNVTEMPKH